MQSGDSSPAFVVGLMDRLNAVTQDNYRRPPSRDHIPKDWKELGIARSFARQAFTLVEILGDEIKPVTSELEMLALEESQNRRGMLDGGYRKNIAREDRIAYLTKMVAKQRRSAQLVTDMMWTELQDQFPENTGHMHLVGPTFKIYTSPCDCGAVDIAVLLSSLTDDKTASRH